MRKLFIVPAALAAGLVFSAGPAAAADEKPARYEYAELRFSRGYSGFGPPPGFPGPAPAFPGGPAFPGATPPGPIGVAGPGAGAPRPPAVPITVHWTTGDEEIEAKGWDELGDKLKAPAPKKESPAGVHKLRVLNKLSADGWEMLDRPSGDPASGIWTFRRRVQ